MSKTKRQQLGFLLLGLQAAATILGLVASVTLLALNSARAKSRDAKRMADVRQMSAALELYSNDKNYYPTSTTNSVLDTVVGLTPTYIGVLPSYPLPADGGCGSDYLYQTPARPTTYTLTFCLGAPTGGYGAGTHTLNPIGIDNGSYYAPTY
jgi:type II secretory pathway pseudopilin PulG